MKNSFEGDFFQYCDDSFSPVVSKKATLTESNTSQSIMISENVTTGTNGEPENLCVMVLAFGNKCFKN